MMFPVNVILHSLVFSWLFFGASVSGLQECDLPIQDKCLFMVSTGRSGSTALMNALNNMDKIFIRGENGGLFYMIESVYNNIKILSNQKFESKDDLKLYRQISRKHKPAFFNGFPNNTAECAVKSLFKTLYGYKEFDTYRVGFKEIRYGPWQTKAVQSFGKTIHHTVLRQVGEVTRTRTQTYQDFKDRISFLLSLCNDPKVILNMRRNSTALSNSGFFLKSQIKVKKIKEFIGWVKQYYVEFPQLSFIVYYEDMYDQAVNQTRAYELMDFLNVPRNPDVTFAGIQKD